MSQQASSLDDYISTVFGQNTAEAAQAADVFAQLLNPAKTKAETLIKIVQELLANRPEAERSDLHQTNAVESLQKLELFMDGTTIQHAYDPTVGKPDIPGEQRTFFTYPYPRPTAGASALTMYHDDNGDIFVLLARNKEKNQRGDIIEPVHPFPFWHFAGGFMDVCDPLTHNPDLSKGSNANPGFPNRTYDHNLEETALREMTEETELKVPKGASVTLMDVNSDYKGKGRHHISASYLVNLGKQDKPPHTAPHDDVYDLRWVNVKDITFTGKEPPNDYTVTMDGNALDLRSPHSKGFDKAVGEMRHHINPYYDPGYPPDDSHLSTKAHEHYDNLEPMSLINASQCALKGTGICPAADRLKR